MNIEDRDLRDGVQVVLTMTVNGIFVARKTIEYTSLEKICCLPTTIKDRYYNWNRKCKELWRDLLRSHGYSIKEIRSSENERG